MANENENFLDDDRLTQPGVVAVITDPEGPVGGVARWLKEAGHAVHMLDETSQWREVLRRLDPHVVCVDTGRDDGPLATRLATLAAAAVASSVVILAPRRAAEGDGAELLPATVVATLRPPFERQLVLVTAAEAVRRSRDLRRGRERGAGVRRAPPFATLVGTSGAMELLFDQITRVARSDVPVFLHGESGTGKELAARAVHQSGGRRDKPFVAINCAAIAESLQESALFGHERGAFTGAMTSHAGLFEQAHGGTLFLDEVGEVSPSVQARLLRTLQDGTLQRVGGTKTVKVDVRVVSATHRDIDAFVRAGRFREDLFYRIVVYPIILPPLRERRDDIPQLLSHLLRKHAVDAGGRVKAVSPAALDVLCRHAWPGNVRELENVVRRAVLAGDSDVVEVRHLPPQLLADDAREGSRPPPLRRTHPSARPPSGPPDGPRSVFPPPSSRRGEVIVPLAELERRAIVHALAVTRNSVPEAARQLGVGRATLYRWLKEQRAAEKSAPPPRAPAAKP